MTKLWLINSNKTEMVCSWIGAYQQVHAIFFVDNIAINCNKQVKSANLLPSAYKEIHIKQKFDINCSHSVHQDLM